MLGSKNNFFLQDKKTLNKKRKEVISYLKLKDYNKEEITIYLEAYDYFCVNNYAFDGATIVKDLIDISELDLDAMLHDYHYIYFNVASNVGTKWKADWLYAKGNERKGKGSYSSFSRFIGLTIIGILFTPYSFIKRGVVKNKIEFLKHYNILIK